MSPTEPKLAPQRVYITRQAHDDPLSLKRVEAMLGSFDAGSVEVVSEADLNEIVGAGTWKSVPRWGAQAPEEQRDPDVVFTTGRFVETEEKKRRVAEYPNLGVRDLYGHHTFWFRADGGRYFVWRQRLFYPFLLCGSACSSRSAPAPTGDRIRYM